MTFSPFQSNFHAILMDSEVDTHFLTTFSRREQERANLRNLVGFDHR